MIWPLIRTSISVALTVAEFIANAYDRARRIGSRLLPRTREDAMPLSSADVKHQQDQINDATSHHS